MHTRTLYMGSHGKPVRALQTLLGKYAARLAIDGKFGPKTEHAVRLAQRRLGLFPSDGLAGPHMLAALRKAAAPGTAAPPVKAAAPPSLAERLGQTAHQAGAAIADMGHHAVMTIAEAVDAIGGWIDSFIEPAKPIPPVLKHAVGPARDKAREGQMPDGEVADPKTMFLSEKGRAFVFRHEAGNGSATAHLHHPTDGSGVTIGPGYDMGARSVSEVTQDLVAIGVDPATAATAAAAAKGAGLYSTPADDFAKDNRSLLNLTVGQQVQLQRRYKGHYENMVRTGVVIPLHQYEFDALVSYAGNPGSSKGWRTTVAYVNQHRPADAMTEIKKIVYSKKSGRVQGLVNRRDAEARLFLYGDYTA